MSENENTGAATGAPKSNGMATASLVLGIVSIALGWILAGILGIITGILAIILAAVAKKKIKADPNMGGKGAATGGMVTGIIGLALYLILWILIAIVWSTAAGAAGDMMQELQNNQEIQDALREGLENSNN
tara:strand:- start:7267 stop:7659 length:393 start_codon:yes stop_codon:yes gene_type:complete